VFLVSGGLCCCPGFGLVTLFSASSLGIGLGLLVVFERRQQRFEFRDALFVAHDVGGDVVDRPFEVLEVGFGLSVLSLRLGQPLGRGTEASIVRVEATRQLAATARPDLVVWPENAWAAGLPLRVERAPEALTGGAAIALLFGSATRVRVRGEERGLNRVLLVDERGDVQGRYDKVELLAFGEYLPLADELPWLRSLSPRSGRVHPGLRVAPLPFRGFRIAALVCLEDMLPRYVRRVMREGAPHLLVNLTNDAWFGDSHAPWIHLALAQLRAVEQRRYLVRATNTGVSAVVDPLGRVVARSGSFTRETLDAEVAMLEGRTPYQTLGDWPGVVALAALLWLAVRRR